MRMSSSSYGKARVRVMRVSRGAQADGVSELSVNVMLHGDFQRAYTHADNHGVVATDTIKNLVNVAARETIGADAEHFCEKLAQGFLERYARIERVIIETRETRWTRLTVNGAPHPHSFVLDANGKPTVRLECSRTDHALRSGMEGFTFLKSTEAGWSDYVIDEFTTLAETQNRIVATCMNVAWLWSATPADPTADNAVILQAMLDIFATSFSHSVQDSLYRMGEAALACVPGIVEISLACPNKHYLPINLAPFGMSSDNLIFTPTDEPHGQIECTILR